MAIRNRIKKTGLLAIDLLANDGTTNLKVTLAISDTAANSVTNLSAGLYQVRSDVDCFMSGGVNPAATLTIANGRDIFGNFDWSNPFYMDGGTKLGVVCDTGVSGNFYYIKISDIL